MLFQIDNTSLSNILTPSWSPSEQEVENLIFSNPEIVAQIFQEDVLLVKRQQQLASKRSDIIGVDTYGNGIVIELKRDSATLGVDTQSLQYASLYGVYKGQKFLDFITLNANDSEPSKQQIIDFLDVPVEKLNETTRIILIARSFDPALFSMGRWLESKGIGFKCICYEPVELNNNQKFLNFSVVFSASPFDEYAFKAFQKIQQREKMMFWHNIGNADQLWWDYLRKEKIITTSYANQNDSTCFGYKKLHQYIKGDKIIAFASGVGVLGWGEVSENPETGYSYQDHGIVSFNQRHFHRLKVAWVCTVDFKDAIQAPSLHSDFGLNWPSSTKQAINNLEGTLALQKELLKRRG